MDESESESEAESEPESNCMYATPHAANSAVPLDRQLSYRVRLAVYSL